MELKDLVPPMELCKQIPEGNFADSALEWIELEYIDGSQKVIYRVVDRRIAFPYRRIPSPTLEEILNEFRNNDVMIILWELIDRISENDPNLATSALKLWLSVTSDKSDKSERGNQ